MSENVKAKYESVDPEGVKRSISVAVDYDFGSNLGEAIALCGEDVVYTMYKAQAKNALQNVIRGKLKQNLSEDKIKSLITTWKPGVILNRVSVTPEEALKTVFPTWSPEAQAKFLAALGA